MRRLLALAAASLAVGAAACSDRDDDIVQQPSPGAPAVPVAAGQAEAAANQAALALGMTRKQLEDANLVSRANVELGEVETLVVDAGGALTHLVVELEGPGDVRVIVPVADVAPIDRNGGKDLVTDLTLAQLQALPAWTPPAR